LYLDKGRFTVRSTSVRPDQRRMARLQKNRNARAWRCAHSMSDCAQAKKLLAGAVNCDSATIPDDARIGAFERWDSLAHLRLVLAIEQQVERQLDPDEAVRIESLADIAALLALAAPRGEKSGSHPN